MTVKQGETVLLLGTKKGLFLLHSEDRRTWRREGPWFAGTSVYHAAFDRRDGRTLWAAATNEHWGPSVQRSTDFGRTWVPSKAEPAYPQGTDLSVTRVWHLAPGADGVTWCGVEPAGLFRTTDDGETWVGVEGLNAWPGRKDWFPGGGGLCLHTILPDPRDARRLVVAASSVGIFETTDGGASWRLLNGGIRNLFVEGGVQGETDHGTCPHKLVRDAADPDLLYMQNHFGVYRRHLRKDDRWHLIETGLPARFGFPMVAHPRRGGTVYAVPLEGDFNRVLPGGRFAVYRTTDAGASWEPLTAGLPQKDAFLTILRDGMATDGADPAGLYVGTTTGQLYGSADEGESWALIAEHLPPILSVAAGVVGGR